MTDPKVLSCSCEEALACDTPHIPTNFQGYHHAQAALDKVCWKPQQQLDLDGSNLWVVTVLKPLAWLQVVDILIYKGREELEVSIDVQTAH